MGSGKGKMKQHWKVAISKKKRSNMPPMVKDTLPSHTASAPRWVSPGYSLTELLNGAFSRTSPTPRGSCRSVASHHLPLSSGLSTRCILLKQHQTATMKIHFSKRYRHGHLFKHMINLGKMLFLLRQAENSHKLQEATHEIAQVDRTLIFRRPQLFCSRCQEPPLNAKNTESGLPALARATQVFGEPEDFCPQSLGCVLGLCWVFSKTQCLNLVLSFNANTCSGQAVLMEQQYGKQGAPRMLSVMLGQLSTIDCAFHGGGEKAQVNKEINLFRENAVPLW